MEKCESPMFANPKTKCDTLMCQPPIVYTHKNEKLHIQNHTKKPGPVKIKPLQNN